MMRTETPRQGRTGDLGFVDAEGYLFVTGRLKDVIIVGGENLAPADIEEAVDRLPGIRYSAAVGIDSERTGTQRLYVVAEVREPGQTPEALSHLIKQIVSRVLATCGHRPARVLLVRPGTIPKTSSGKIQRSRLGHLIGTDALQDQVVHGPGAHGGA